MARSSIDYDFSEQIAAFGTFAADYLDGYRPPDRDLAAALGAVKIVPQQAGWKLSPVVRSGKRGRRGKLHGGRAVAPYCVATYVSFETCPRSCPFLRDPDTGEPRGCFSAAEVNAVARWMPLLDASARLIENLALRARLIGLAEAFLIDQLFPQGVPQDGTGGRGRPVRLHVAGDVADAMVVRALADVVDRWYARAGGAVWVYTHRWRGIPRRVWRRISVRASVETVSDIIAARRLGYAVAMVVPTFGGKRILKNPDAPGVRLVACPQEVQEQARRAQRKHTPGEVHLTQSITCVECDLCLHRSVDIAFCGHGAHAAAALRSITEKELGEELVRRRLRVVR